MKQVRFTLPNNTDSKRPRLDLPNQYEKGRHDLSPIVYITSGKVQTALPQRAFVVLLDSGSTHTMIKRTSLPHGAIPNKGAWRKTTTTNGTYSLSEFVIIKEVKFPEFGNMHIGSIKADIFDSPTCRYDVILGRDLLERLGLKMDFHNHRMTWGERTIPMKP